MQVRAHWLLSGEFGALWRGRMCQTLTLHVKDVATTTFWAVSLPVNRAAPSPTPPRQRVWTWPGLGRERGPGLGLGVDSLSTDSRIDRDSHGLKWGASVGLARLGLRQGAGVGLVGLGRTAGMGLKRGCWCWCWC